MKLNEHFSVRTQILWEKIIPGLFWLAYSIFSICNFEKQVPLLLIGGAALAIFRVITALKGEATDEMAKENYQRALASTAKAMRNVYCLSTVVAALVYGLLEKYELQYVHSIPYIFFALLGIHDILVGIYFNKYEAE